MAHFGRRLAKYGITVLAVLLCGAPSTWALNATQLIGVGAIHRSLAGAGVARPLDSTAVYLNPAGLQRLGPRLDTGFTVVFSDVDMDTSTAPAGNPAAVNVDSNDTPALLPFGSLVLPLGKRAAVGMGTFITNGFGVDFPVSRLAAGGNTFDMTGRYGLLRITPAASYKVLDNLWVGGGIQIGIAMLNTDGATAAFTETTGRNRTDQALGISGNFGAIYEPLSWMSLGVTYNSRFFFQQFDRYKDLLSSSLDLPQMVAAGVAVRPLSTDELTLMADFRWINYSQIGIISNDPTAGGFGWRDQYIGIVGVQYDFRPRLHFPVELRMGYNYGRNVITPGAVTANILAGNGIKHHLSAGVGLYPVPNLEMHLSYTRNFRASLVDDGSSVPALAGGRVSGDSNIFSLQFAVHFGGPPPPPPTATAAAN